MKAQTRVIEKSDAKLLADIARAYYLDNRSKVDIANRFSVTRFQVAKMLDDARELGIVSIEIRDPGRLSSAREHRLAEILGIDRVVVVDTADSGSTAGGELLGIAVMETLKELVRPHTTLGISWSRTLDLAARFMPTLPPCDIVQLAGALQLPGSGSLPRIISQLGSSPGITTWPIYAPLVVDEVSTANDLMRQPEIANALSQADHLDLAVVAIGGWLNGESTVWEKVSDKDRRGATRAGAVAEISGRLLDGSGDPVRTGLDERTIGVRLDQLARSGQIIAVARGVRRADAVRATVKAGLVTCLVVDSVLAEHLLEPSEHPA